MDDKIKKAWRKIRHALIGYPNKIKYELKRMDDHWYYITVGCRRLSIAGGGVYSPRIQSYMNNYNGEVLCGYRISTEEAIDFITHEKSIIQVKDKRI